MAKNFKQPGDVIDVAAPAGGVSSGDGVLIGSLFGVAAADAAASEIVSIGVEGVYELPKLSTDAMSVGDKVNWNNTNKEFQNAISDLDGAAVVVEAAGASTTLVKVRLTPV